MRMFEKGQDAQEYLQRNNTRRAEGEGLTHINTEPHVARVGHLDGGHRRNQSHKSRQKQTH